MVLGQAGMAGLIVVALHLLVAAVATAWVPADPLHMSADQILLGPSWDHWFGTDQLGRDVLSRTLAGGRIAIATTAAAALLALGLGATIGISAGVAGGFWDDLAMHAVDALLAVPKLLFLLLVVGVFGGGLATLVLTFGVLHGLSVARVARASAREIASRDFVWAARARGEGWFGLVVREVLPNLAGVLLVDGAMRWSWMLITFSSLSFLGLGVSPPTPDWGSMIADARTVLGVAPWAALAPCLALTSLILGVNFLGGALGHAMSADHAARTATSL
ncbi:ABC transporter permease [Labrys wisconsinensis]|uniref:Peptide/nickel transport system permease protein n=1 Tax=Labrys wisconsinensis TaxID=425677 RepID=A0ABU0JC04_9HYPH|nr:ABC transporter permease [Labrys wisconsinensis]MDQ0471031.1 peptide/nickel transport system permease protein [Labrys wisconsinensis]